MILGSICLKKLNHSTAMVKIFQANNGKSMQVKCFILNRVSYIAIEQGKL